MKLKRKEKLAKNWIIIGKAENHLNLSNVFCANFVSSQLFLFFFLFVVDFVFLSIVCVLQSGAIDYPIERNFLLWNWRTKQKLKNGLDKTKAKMNFQKLKQISQRNFYIFDQIGKLGRWQSNIYTYVYACI